MEALQAAIGITNSLSMAILLVELAFLVNTLRKMDITAYKVTTVTKDNTTTPREKPSGNIVKRSPVHIDDETAYMIEKKNKRQQNPVL